MMKSKVEALSGNILASSDETNKLTGPSEYMSVTVKRPNGKTEEKKFELYNTPFPFSQNFVNRAYIAFKEMDRGELIKAEKVLYRNNLRELQEEYNDAMNEGGEGYVPDYHVFKNHRRFSEWTDNQVLYPNDDKIDTTIEICWTPVS